VLLRGYAILRSGRDGKVVKRIAQIQAGEEVGFEIADGFGNARILSAEPSQQVDKS